MKWTKSNQHGPGSPNIKKEWKQYEWVRKYAKEGKDVRVIFLHQGEYPEEAFFYIELLQYIL